MIPRYFAALFLVGILTAVLGVFVGMWLIAVGCILATISYTIGACRWLDSTER